MSEGNEHLLDQFRQQLDFLKERVLPELQQAVGYTEIYQAELERQRYSRETVEASIAHRGHLIDVQDELEKVIEIYERQGRQGQYDFYQNSDSPEAQLAYYQEFIDDTFAEIHRQNLAIYGMLSKLRRSYQLANPQLPEE